MSSAARVFGTEAEDYAIIQHKKGGYRDSIDDVLTRTLLAGAVEDEDSYRTGAAVIIAREQLGLKDIYKSETLVPNEIVTYFVIDTYNRNYNLPLINSLTFYLTANAFKSNNSVIKISNQLNNVIQLEVLGTSLFPMFSGALTHLNYFPDRKILLRFDEIALASKSDRQKNYHFQFAVQAGQTYQNTDSTTVFNLTPIDNKLVLANPINISKLSLQFFTPRMGLLPIPNNDFMHVKINYTTNVYTTVNKDSPYAIVRNGIVTGDCITFENFAITGTYTAEDFTQITYRANPFRVSVGDAGAGTFQLAQILPAAIKTAANRPADITNPNSIPVRIFIQSRRIRMTFRAKSITAKDTNFIIPTSI